MPSAVDTILFDLDDTLCGYRRPGSELLSVAFERVGVEPFFDIEDYYGRYDGFIEPDQSIQRLRERCFAAIASERGYDPAVGRDLARAYADERDHRNVRALPGAVEAIEELAVDHRLGIVTNGSPEMQRLKLSALPFSDAFETVVYAGYDAPAKPDPAPFERALSGLDSAPGRAVHVGNSLRTDVSGARAAGLHAAWVPDGTADPDPDPTPDYTLDSLHDLLDPPWTRGTGAAGAVDGRKG